MRRGIVWCLTVCWSLGHLWADGPADNVADKVRPVPPPGIQVSDAEATALKDALAELQKQIDELQQPSPNPGQTALRKRLLPDVTVLHKAVRDALTYSEFFKPEEVAEAKQLLEIGKERAAQLLKGEAPWTQARGLVIRGYVSQIDGSVQPYGLVIPEGYNPQGTDKLRLDIWCHGRGEVLSEVNFLAGRRKQVGQIAPANTIVLHPYGRYCNANKFAGEIDVLEALASVEQNYRIDPDRIVMRGFSMGGAACWQFAVHYADRWVAATPGAGFSETPEFLRVFQKEDVQPTDYERRLWKMYDCPDWCLNLAQLPTIAYSGEIDSQKQAADIMESAMLKQGLRLVHLIGPKTAHSYHPDSLKEIERRLESIVTKGRNRVPKELRFVTYTLRYNRMHWVTVDELGEHWEEATVHAKISGSSEITVTTKNVQALTLSFPAGWAPFDPTQPVKVVLDGQRIEAPRPMSDESWESSFHRVVGQWHEGHRPAVEGTQIKHHGLQGPIDDAFLESFLFVQPTGQPAHEATGKWVAAESQHAIDHWRKQFRGDARVKNDADIKDEDIAANNLVLWGDPQSNQVLKKIADKLPIQWQAASIHVGREDFPADQHVLVLIAPNPLNPEKYVVLNSGFTFREYDYLNNARQVSKLPDWAVIDITVPSTSRSPGKVKSAGFFNEFWHVTEPGK